ncbi:MAG: glycosyltransferase family 61 protein [Rickettsiales bacterium]|nr:MAG: glycosyltransferase family 61 protein [Rickettsiales bacterium]
MDTKLFRLYKLTLANFLNRFAMLLFRVSSKFCRMVILLAIYFDPSRSIFKKNFISLNRNHNNKLPPAFKQKTFPFYSFAEGCKIIGKQIKFLNTNQTTILSLPKVINSDFKIDPAYECEANLPDTFIAEFENAIIFSDTDLIMVQDRVLYDEISRNEKYIYGIKSPVIYQINGNSVTIKLPKKPIKIINFGIHFTKDHSKNYFHWIIECLPRLSLIDNLDKNIPLIVDYDLPNQFFEALLLVKGDRKVIKINKEFSYKVKKLYYPSQLSVLHDNYGLPRYDKDAIYSPKAINYVRNTILKNLNISPDKKNRKIYVSRKNSNYRQLLNSTEIENFLVKDGFEILFPENLSFASQVEVFSQAKIIVGQSGAGMTNFIFAPIGCKVIMMAGDDPYTNLHGFHMLAKEVGIELKFLLGKRFNITQPYALHADFCIDIQLLLNQLKVELSES